MYYLDFKKSYSFLYFPPLSLSHSCVCLKGSIVLLDINPFDKLTTNPLLFSWDELNKGAAVLPELRLVDPSSGIQPLQSVASRLPKVVKELLRMFIVFIFQKDAVDLATGEDIHKLVDLLKIVSYFQFQNVSI